MIALLAFVAGLTLALVGAPHYPRLSFLLFRRWNALVDRVATWVASLHKEL